MNKKMVSLAVLGCLVLIGCEDKKGKETAAQAVEPTAKTNTQKTASPPQPVTSVAVPHTNNSDGSKTYISSTTVCASDVPREASNQTCGFGGSSISLYAVGKNFIAIDEESLQVDTLSFNGVDIRKNRKQEDNFKLGSFPKASDDGKYFKWDIDIASGYHRQGELAIKGSLDAFTSNNLVEEMTKPFKLSDFASFSIGPIQVQGTRASEESPKDFFKNDEDVSEEDLALFEKIISKSKELGDDSSKENTLKMFEGMGLSEEKITQLTSKLFVYMFQEAFSSIDMGGNANEISIKVVGSDTTLDRLELFSDGKKLDSRGWSGWNNTKTYQFQKPSNDEVSLKVYYWKNPEKVVLNFDF